MAVAFSNDNTKIVSGSDDKMICVWSAESGQVSRLACGCREKWWCCSRSQLLQRLDGHAGKVMSAAFSEDGSKIVSGSDDKTVRMWSVADDVKVACALVPSQAKPASLQDAGRGPYVCQWASGTFTSFEGVIGSDSVECSSTFRSAFLQNSESSEAVGRAVGSGNLKVTV